MNKGIYIAVSGAIMRQAEMEVIIQNIANAETAGYKRQVISFSDYLLKDNSKVMNSLSYAGTDFSMGNLIRTGNALDVAIVGSGFIALEGGYYTRQGNLTKDEEGYLITTGGLKVLGENGPVMLPEGAVEITDRAEILVNGQRIDRIRIVDFQDYSKLQRLSAGLYRTTQQEIASEAVLRQGYLEGSNVEVVEEMARMIMSLREFEMFQKAIQTLDEAASKVNNELGRV